MNTDQYERYAVVCERLIQLSLDLSNAGKCHPRLSHQLFLWPLVQSPLCAEVWDSLVASQKGKLPRNATEVQWDRFPDGTGCSRYYGVGDGPGLQTALEAFLRLAKEGQRILESYWELGFCGPYSWNLPLQCRCYVGGHYDWLTLVCQQSLGTFFSPSTQTCVILPAWQFEFSLLHQHDLFSAAAEVVGDWLPDYWNHRIEPSNADNDRPRWDADSRTLWFGNTLVKKFIKHAYNQFILLEAFEAAQWPRTITAPECFLTNLRTRRGIRETVDGLRRRRSSNAIQFRQDGVQVFWEPVG
jgi:hypothetical protein